MAGKLFLVFVKIRVPRVRMYVGCTEMGKMAGSPKTLQNLPDDDGIFYGRAVLAPSVNAA